MKITFFVFGFWTWESDKKTGFLGDPDDKEMEGKQVLCVDNHH